MQAWIKILLLVLTGIVGAWVGYWLGHAAGWSTDAEFPFRIGGGARAIGVAIAVSFLSVVGVGWSVLGRPLARYRRLLASGVPGHATIRRVWRTGVFVNAGGAGRHQLAFELEMHPDGRPDYTATATCLADETEEAAYAPGREVTVRYDASHPTRVAVAGPLAMPRA